MRTFFASPWTRRAAFGVWSGGTFAAGYAVRRSDDAAKDRELPPAYPRACCDAAPLNEKQHTVMPKLASIVGAAHVERDVEQRGSRLGRGVAHAVVRPGTIQEAIDCLQACVDGDVCVIPQGANTGLTGASVPRDALDRPSVVINLKRLTAVSPIDGGERMVCCAGAGIHDVLQRAAAAEPARESHSVLGSLFLNPTVAAGVAFGSGGTQLRKGPVYTERLLYAAVGADGKVTLHNTLGVRGAPTADDLFAKLEAPGGVGDGDVEDASRCGAASEQRSYRASVCACDGRAGRDVARCNAATHGPPPNRSEGKVLILASVHDTFPKPQASHTLWVGVDDFDTAQAFKREVCLGGGAADLPASVEYMDGSSVRVVDEAGRILCWAIGVVGIGETLKRMWDMKLAFEALPIPLAPTLADRLLYTFNGLCPSALPPAVRQIADRRGHHVLVSVGDYGGGERARFDDRLGAFVAKRGAAAVDVHACGAAEVPRVNHFRFATAPAFRTWCVGNGVDGVSVDYALPKAECGAPPMPDGTAAVRMRYSHFGCNVVHEDIAFQRGVDPHAAKLELKHEVERMGGKLPAEHGFGTEYKAPEEVKRRWRKMDPLNVMNPGVGGLSVARRYGE